MVYEEIQMNKETLYIVMPAYNEEANIKNVIDDWYPIIEKMQKMESGADSRLVIIDDGSRDDTYKMMCEYAKERPLFVPLTKENEGHGATVLYGYQYALEHDADYIFQTDSDGQTLPEEFEQFWDEREKYDFLIGYRNNREDGLSRVIVTKTLRTVIRICFGVDIIDANTPYRLMSENTLRENIKFIPDKFNLSNVILSVIYHKKNQKVKYIPITFRPRQGGVNSINIRKIIKIGLQAVNDFREINKSLSEIEKEYKEA